MRGITLAIGFAVGNFVYQAATFQEWHIALDRSVFQAIAVFSVILLCPPKQQAPK